MKTLLDCEQVFDVLTRQPFPSGSAHDYAVELHLQGCHECRQMAEALRPVAELLHETLDDEQRNGLPSYDGEREVELTSRIMQQVSLVEVRPPQRWFSSGQLSAALAVVIVATITVSSMAWQQIAEANKDKGLTSNSVLMSKTIQLAALKVSDECLLPEGDSSDPATRFESTRYQCCTSCHSESQENAVPAEAVLRNGGCFVCHDVVNDS